MCALQIALSPELGQSRVRSQSCFITPSCSISSKSVRVGFYPKGLGSLGRQWYRGYDHSIPIPDIKAVGNYSPLKKPGFAIGASGQASNNESFDELLDPSLASGEGGDFIGSIELRRKQDLAQLFCWGTNWGCPTNCQL